MKELEQLTTASDFWNDNQKAQSILKEISSHKKWVETYAKLSGDVSDIGELIEMGSASADDVKAINDAIDELEKAVNQFEINSLLSGEDDFRDAFVTIHPGAGGTESQDWADMLFRMYNRWSERKDFTVELLDYQPGEEAGLKSVTFMLNGENAFGLMSAEAGVHRLVRISPFDQAARRHTSFASVYVWPEFDEEIEIEIDEKDLRIDTYRAGGAGGQHVNRTDSA
ncbi:MAG: PCRF domain-containing protein, partial [Candidatus Zixiibacteriota bacterium]